MTTDQGEMTHTTGEAGVTSSSSRVAALYFECFVVVIGVIGTAANGLVLYALLASKQHKKHELIVNQNVLDLCGCLFLILTYGLKLSNMKLSGSLGYWLCMLILNESLLIGGVSASWLNLIIIAIERYLRVIHPIWSKKHLRTWMIKASMAIAWIAGFVQQIASGFETSVVINGVCYGYVIWKSPETALAATLYYVFVTYFIVVVIFMFCYGKILMAIRRQSRVMASPNTAGSRSHQTQSHIKIQSDVIKTMILVCTFFAVAWLPEKIYVVLMSMNPNLTLLDGGYCVILFLGFLYICINLVIINHKTLCECCQLNLYYLRRAQRGHSFSISAPTRLSMPQSSMQLDAS